jgi:hypothetical protein
MAKVPGVGYLLFAAVVLFAVVGYEFATGATTLGIIAVGTLLICVGALGIGVFVVRRRLDRQLKQTGELRCKVAGDGPRPRVTDLKVTVGPELSKQFGRLTIDSIGVEWQKIGKMAPISFRMSWGDIRDVSIHDGPGPAAQSFLIENLDRDKWVFRLPKTRNLESVIGTYMAEPRGRV